MGMFDFIKKIGNAKEVKAAAAKPGKTAKKKLSPQKKLKPKPKPKTGTAKKVVKKTAAMESVPAKKSKAEGAKGKAVPAATKPQPLGPEIGRIIHYFDKISVGIIKLKAELKLGDTIHIHGAHDDFKQVVSSLQVDHKDIPSAGKGKEVGIKVSQRVRENDRVYKVD